MSNTRRPLLAFLLVGVAFAAALAAIVAFLSGGEPHSQTSLPSRPAAEAPLPTPDKPATIAQPPVPEGRDASAAVPHAPEPSDLSPAPATRLRFVHSGNLQPLARASVIVTRSTTKRVIRQGSTRWIVFGADPEDEEKTRASGPRTESVVRSTTDADGITLVEGLVSGVWEVALDDDFLYVASEPSFEAQVDEPAEPREFTVERGGHVSGAVVTAGGHPIADAAVSVARGFDSPTLLSTFVAIDEEEEVEARPQSFPAFHSERTVRTDDSGRFALRGVRPRKRLSVSVKHPAHAPASSSPVEVKAGKRVTVATVTLTAGGELVVRVVGLDSQPLARVRIRISDQRGFAGMGSASATTDETGVARRAWLRPGKVTVTISSATHIGVTLEDVEIVEGATTERTVTLDAGVALGGVVVNDSGEPISGAQVIAWFERTSRHTYTDETGRFRLEALPPKLVSVQVHAGGYPQPEERRLTPGTPDVRIVLQRGATITGQVLAPSGEPATAFEIAVLAQGGGFSALLGEGLATWTKHFEDEAGRFEIEALEPGSYVLRARSLTNESGSTETLTVEAGQRLDNVIVRLSTSVSIRGRVLDLATREPVAGAKVAWTDKPEPFGAARMFVDFAQEHETDSGITTRDDGSFLLQNVPTQARAITVSHRRFLPGRVEPLPAPGAGVEMLLARGGTIVGSVRDEAGRPQPGANVMLHSGFLRAGFAQTQEDGGFSMARVKPGTYTIGVAEAGEGEMGAIVFGGGIRDSIPVTVAEGETVRVDLGGRPRVGCRIHGRLMASAQPVEGATVMLVETGAGTAALMRPRTSLTDGAGAFEFGGVPPGSYTLAAEFEGSTVFTSARVAGESELRIDLVAPEGSLIVDLVDSQTGEPLSGGEVIIYPASREEPASLEDFYEGGLWHQPVDEGGRATFRHLPSGRFEVLAGRSLFSDPLGTGPHASYALERAGVEIGDAGESSLVLRLSPGQTLEGRVVAADGRPVPHPSVALEDEAGRSASGFFVPPGGPDGRYRIDGLKPGSYAAIVHAPGFAPLRRSAVRISAGDPNRADFTLTAGGSTSVTAVDASGLPVAGATVEFRDAAGRRLASGIKLLDLFSGATGAGVAIETDASRVLVHGHLAAGSYLVTARKDGREGSARVDVREGSTSSVRLVVK